MINLSQSYKTHILGWVIFGVYEITSVAVVTGSFGTLGSYLEHYPINILLFYIHCRVVLPWSFKSGRSEDKLLLVPLLILEVLIYLFLNYAADYLMGNPSLSYFGKSGIRWPFFFSSLWRAIYFMGFSTTYYLFLRYLYSSKQVASLEKDAMQKALQEKQLELELADSKNSHLRAQINPHFLMNTLSFIYNKTHKTEPHSARAVLYLSKILRYIIEVEHGPDLSPIGPEIEQVENLFELCRVKDEQVHVEFNYLEQIEEIKVIPLILLTLAENMIKHGNLSEANFPGEINIEHSGQHLHIVTSNLINTGINDNGIHSGIKNIAQRLQFMYGKQANIRFETYAEKYFRVEISIPVNDVHSGNFKAGK